MNITGISFADYFARSRRIGLADRIFSFLFTLGCGYTASFTLDMAMSRNHDGLIQASMIFGLLLVLGLPTVWILSRMAKHTRMDERQKFREQLYGRILQNRIEAGSVGQQDELLGDISNQVAEQYQERIPKMIEGICIVLGAAALMCTQSVLIGILFPMMGLIQILPVFTYEKWTSKIYEDSWDSDEAETDWITQGFDGIRTLKAYGAEKWFLRRYRDMNRHGIAVGNRSVATGGLEGILYATIDVLLRYGSYLILGACVLHGNVRAASLPILVVLSGYVFSAMDQLFTFFRYRSIYRSAVQRLEEAVRTEPGQGRHFLLCADRISKSFEENPVLHGLNLTISAGERVLLHGANGSGKSTLIRILLGELTPDDGHVELGGRISAALQEEPALTVPGMVYIRELKEQADWEETRFLRFLEDFSFPTELLEKPLCELSGGERKKFFLAVALSRQADLLILDEPTNHLDRESCQALKDHLRSRSGAMLICSHDPQLQLDWDQVLELKGGEFHE